MNNPAPSRSSPSDVTVVSTASTTSIDTMPDRAVRGFRDFREIVVVTDLGDVVVHTNSLPGAPGNAATLLIHGAAGSWTTWLPMLHAAETAGAPLKNVVALDLPGWGASDNLPADVTVENMVDAIAQVAKTLGYTRWHVAGHSLGGHLALTMAVRYAQSTLSVTAISATGPGALAVLRHPIQKFGTLPLLAGMLGAMTFLSALGATGYALIRLLHRLHLFGPLSAVLFARHATLDPAVIATLANEIRPHAFIHAADAATRYDEGEWARISCPVTLLHGERDVFVSSNDDDWFAAVLPHATTHTIAQAGHFAHLERPRRYLDAVASRQQSIVPLIGDEATAPH
ncbi:MAG: alpha/beta fold hydrolase [Rhodoglobus sp.]